MFAGEQEFSSETDLLRFADPNRQCNCLALKWVSHGFLISVYSQHFTLKDIYLSNPETRKVCKQGSHAVAWFHFTLQAWVSVPNQNCDCAALSQLRPPVRHVQGMRQSVCQYNTIKMSSVNLNNHFKIFWSFCLSFPFVESWFKRSDRLCSQLMINWLLLLLCGWSDNKVAVTPSDAQHLQ